MQYYYRPVCETTYARACNAIVRFVMASHMQHSDVKLLNGLFVCFPRQRYS
jgi:hypothetical protein